MTAKMMESSFSPSAAMASLLWEVPQMAPAMPEAKEAIMVATTKRLGRRPRLLSWDSQEMEDRHWSRRFQ